MAPRTIEYFFTLQSPWSYIGHAEFVRVAERHGATIDYRPMNLMRIFPETGGLPLAKRHPARQRYRMIELQRWVAKRDLPMHLHPRHWPLDPAMTDKIVVAVGVSGGDVERIVPRLFSGIFEREEDLADPTVLEDLLRKAGFDAGAVFEEAKSARVDQAYESNATLALKCGAIGAPTYALDGEIFWGQDRLPLLEEALVSGRLPFLPDV